VCNVALDSTLQWRLQRPVLPVKRAPSIATQAAPAPSVRPAQVAKPPPRVRLNARRVSLEHIKSVLFAPTARLGIQTVTGLHNVPLVSLEPSLPVLGRASVEVVLQERTRVRLVQHSVLTVQ